MEKIPLYICTVIACLGLCYGQGPCNFPVEWYSPNPYYYTRYTTAIQLTRINTTDWTDFSTFVSATCVEMDKKANSPMAVISFTSTNDKKYCIEAIYEETAFFVRKSPEVTRDDPYMVSNCSEVLGPRTEFKAYISYPFSKEEWEMSPPSDILSDGSYGFTYSDSKVISGDETGCVDANARLTVSGISLTTTSTCLDLPQTYSNPFAGPLFVVAGLPDNQLSVGTMGSTSGMMIVAMEDSSDVPGLNYKFFIMRYMVRMNADETSNFELFFTTGTPEDPTGYVDMDQVPTTQKDSIKLAALNSFECQTGGSALCNNSGTCIQGWNTYTCRCALGFEGMDCSQNINECNPQPCINGGQCMDMVNAFQCVCSRGYTGSTCAFTDTCDPIPCQNQGSCYVTNTTYICVCPEGYFGKDCERENICLLQEPCDNGGSCLFSNTTFHCICPYGFTGDRCQEFNGTGCTDDTCQHEGTCVMTQTGPYCQCTIYYGGDSCEALRDWFIVFLVLLALLVLILLILLVLGCCFCCCGWRPNNANNYATMENSNSSLRLDAPPQNPGTVEFNFSPANPYYGIQMVK